MSTDNWRKPPHSTSAEQSVLGSLLLDARAWSAVADVATAATFFERRHALIFAAIERLSERQSAVDVITVAEELERNSKADEVGGLAYLGELANNTPSTGNVRAYAELVRKYAESRELIRIAASAINRTYQGDNPTDVVTDIESEFLKMSERRSDQGPRIVSEILRDTYLNELEARAEGKAHGLMTGFTDLDRLTSGLRPGQLIVIAARPGEGKTTLVGNIAEHVAVRLGQPVLFFSLEMTASELTDRFMSSLSDIPLAAILNGNGITQEFQSAMNSLIEAPLQIDDTGALYIQQIRARALRAKRQHGLALVIVDYLQLVRAKAERRHEEVATISRSLKALAKELNVPVIALSQLNRGNESRNDKRPTLANLRESGQIEQDADIVALIYRDTQLLDGLSVVELAKHRNGPTDRVFLVAQLDRVRFRSHAGPVDKQRHTEKSWSPYDQ